MAAQTIDPKLIRPNPYQPRRTMDPAKLAELAESIRANGLLQPPVVRRAGAGYELAFGHRRFEAWRMANPGQAFPADVQDLTDQQMAEQAATENGQRDDLNPIERAAGIKLLMETFSLSQTQAGRYYGLTSQGAVSNVLGLLKHPKEIQDLVAAGELTERQARDLRLVSRINPKAAIGIAKAAAEEDERNRPIFISDRIGRELRDRGRNLPSAPFDPAWPAAPIKVDKPNTVKGEPAELASCNGCQYRYKLEHSDLCGNPPCYDLKVKHGKPALVEAASKRMGIPMAAPNEAVTEIEIDYRNREKLKALLQKKHPAIRLVPSSANYYSSDLTGSRHISLATTDQAEIKRLVSAGGKTISTEMKKKAAAAASPAQLAKLKAQEEKEREERRAAAAAANRSKTDTLWLIGHVARTIGPRMELAGGIAVLAFESIKHSKQLLIEWGEAHGIISELVKAGDYRAAIVAHLVSHDLFDGYGMSKDEHYDWARAQRIVEKAVTDKLKLKLPDGWNKAPVHRTPANCWHCGRFSSNAAGVTKAEQAAGWEASRSDIACPSCRRPADAADLASGKKKPKSSVEIMLRDDALAAAKAAKKGKRLAEVFAQ